jgi:hypothetical protein
MVLVKDRRAGEVLRQRKRERRERMERRKEGFCGCMAV